MTQVGMHEAKTKLSQLVERAERGEEIVIARNGTPVTVDELRDHVLARGLAAHKAPARLLVVDDLPRTAAGKVRKADLRQSLRDGWRG